MEEIKMTGIEFWKSIVSKKWALAAFTMLLVFKSTVLSTQLIIATVGLTGMFLIFMLDRKKLTKPPIRERNSNAAGRGE